MSTYTETNATTPHAAAASAAVDTATTTATSPRVIARPELLAPAGDWEAMRAAVANGADAVYFGLSHAGASQFNARYRATNFTLDELPRVTEYLHGHNVRGYVTFNVLVFSDELPEAARFIRAVAEAGADAVIVQDLGLARLIAKLAPGLHVHGSTQMTLTEPLGVEFVRRLGVKRVILARELSAADVRKVTAGTDLPVEVFVHGALCVSYSGQCLTSEAIGGRSANRGQCAQACRLPYDLVVDGVVRDLGDKAYLLSPQDLAAYDLIGDLADAGVCSVKIEGRLKSAQYVAATTQTYRSALDAIGKSGPFVLPRDRELELAQSFSRGFTHGFLDGVDHQSLVHARFPKSRGVKVGKVVGVSDRGVVVELERPATGHAGSRGRGPSGFAVGSELKVGDGVVFDEGHPEQDEQGGRVFEVRPVHAATPAGTRTAAIGRTAPSPGTPGEGWEGGRSRGSAGFRDPAPAARGTPSPAFPRGTGGGSEARAAGAAVAAPSRVEISFDRGGVNLSAVAVGAIVWKTDDPAVRRRLQDSYKREKVANRAPIDAAVSAVVGGRLTVEVRDAVGRTAAVAWDQPLAAAQKFPLTEATFREQVGRLGDSPFELRRVTGLESPSGAMVPKSVLNDLRREAVTKLLALREDVGRRTIAEPDALDRLRAEIAERFGTDAPPRGTGLQPVPSASDVARAAVPVTPDPLARVANPCHGAAAPPIAHRPAAAIGSLPLPRLHVLVRTLDQLRAAVAWSHGPSGLRPATVYCDFEDVRRYKEAVAVARSAGVPVGLATVRVVKPGEEGLLRQVAACEPDLLLVRNLAGLSFFAAHAAGVPVVADYALNVANELTAALLLEHGVRRMVPSYDLNWGQMSALLGRVSPACFEVVVHQHMPMFHMEHCSFAHLLSDGKDYRDCGRPCDRHRVDLRDRVGVNNPLVADVGCRNTVYNGQAQSGIEYVPTMRAMGVADFRVELLRESAAEAGPLLTRYADVLTGQTQPHVAVRSLRVLNQLGVTRGTLERD
jgi:putative protease